MKLVTYLHAKNALFHTFNLLANDGVEQVTMVQRVRDLEQSCKWDEVLRTIANAIAIRADRALDPAI